VTPKIALYYITKDTNTQEDHLEHGYEVGIGLNHIHGDPTKGVGSQMEREDRHIQLTVFLRKAKMDLSAMMNFCHYCILFCGCLLLVVIKQKRKCCVSAPVLVRKQSFGR
jgi:hypothetical protein